MKKKLIIFGGSGMGDIAKYYFDVDSNYEPVCFTLDGAYVKEASFQGLPMIPFEEVAEKFSPQDHEIFIALSYRQMNKLRARKYDEAKKKGFTIASYVSSKCTYLSEHKPGENSFILENNTIQPFVRIGNNVTLWSGCCICHHTVIEDHNFVGPNAAVSGHCHIESYCFVGVNSTIHHKVRLGAETLVGAGAVIAKDTEFQSVWVPAPAVKLEQKSNLFKF